jgi:prefoldin alpha subunit
MSNHHSHKQAPAASAHNNTAAAQEQSRREKMFEAELTNQQLEQLQQYMQKLQKQINEISALHQEIRKYGSVQGGEELLVPIANGIFVKAIASKDKEFMVNIGAGTIVPKTEAEVLAIVDKQLHDLHEYDASLQKEFDGLLAKLASMQKEFEKE